MIRSLPERKNELRQHLRRANDRANRSERIRGSRVIGQLLKGLEPFQQAETLLFYGSTPDEPDTWDLLHDTLQLGKAVGLPRFDPRTGAYTPAQISSPAVDLEEGRFGIREPSKDCPKLPWLQVDLVLVPGMGFDPMGHRLGRGNGFYDRILANIRGIKVALAFEWQIVVAVPCEDHDIRMDYIVTPSGVIEVPED